MYLFKKTLQRDFKYSVERHYDTEFKAKSSKTSRLEYIFEISNFTRTSTFLYREGPTVFIINEEF